MLHLKYPKLQNKYGCWIVNNRAFLKKIEALEYASSNNHYDISFYYHNHVWESFDLNLLGKKSLVDLYRIRAQQLRDSYKYLVLHFSGGSDSYNILHTFLSNKIKLDEIVVKWPKYPKEKKLYIPNSNDTSARNALSEWDFAIDPILKRVSQMHPEIKINVIEYDQNLLEFNSTNVLENIVNKNTRNNYTIASFFMVMNPDLFASTYQAETTAHIFGIEKPVLSYDEQGVYLHFLDHAFDLLAVNHELGIKEPFYWSADLPLLPMEQAFQAAMYIELNPQLKFSLINNSKNLSASRGKRLLQIQNSLFKNVLYGHSWNPTTFQVKKPNLDRSDWYFWMHEVKEFNNVKNKYLNIVAEMSDNIDDFWMQDALNVNAGFKKLRTKGFKILDFKR